MPIKDITKLAKKSKTTVAAVAREMGRSRQWLYSKLSSDNLKYNEAKRIGKILGYSLYWINDKTGEKFKASDIDDDDRARAKIKDTNL